MILVAESCAVALVLGAGPLAKSRQYISNLPYGIGLMPKEYQRVVCNVRLGPACEIIHLEPRRPSFTFKCIYC